MNLQGWCAVATSLGYLRVYSSTGMQLLLITLKGPVLCMSGHGAELAVYYHTGAPWGTTTTTKNNSTSMSSSSDQNNQTLVLSPQLAVEVRSVCSIQLFFLNMCLSPPPSILPLNPPFHLSPTSLIILGLRDFLS